MKNRVMNATVLPRVYYARHMVQGVAHYRPTDAPEKTILISDDTIRNMGPSFLGKPVYVYHVEEVDLENLEHTADGYVVDSFYNPVDGAHWVKFVVVTDRGHEAIRKGWKVSNAYELTDVVGGGRYHGLDYQEEVRGGIYEHLAIVPDPRYDEAIILTPEQFKAFNEQKTAELAKLKNSKGDEPMKFNFFTKKKVENSIDAEMSVELPKSKKEKTLAVLINEADERELNSLKPIFCNGAERVKVGETEMSVNELVEKYSASLSTPVKAENEEDEEVENADDEEVENADDKDKEVENTDDEDDKPKNSDDEEEEKKKNKAQNAADKAEKKKHFDKLKNAQSNAVNETYTVEIGMDKVARGKSRYGSK